MGFSLFSIKKPFNNIPFSQTQKSCSSFVVGMIHGKTLVLVHKTCWLTSQNFFAPLNCQKKIGFSLFSIKIPCNNIPFSQHILQLGCLRRQLLKGVVGEAGKAQILPLHLVKTWSFPISRVIENNCTQRLTFHPTIFRTFHHHSRHASFAVKNIAATNVTEHKWRGGAGGGETTPSQNYFFLHALGELFVCLFLQKVLNVG